MKINKLTPRYVNAIYDLAIENDQLPALLNDFSRFIPLFFKNDYISVKLHFSTPSERSAFLQDLRELNFSDLFINFLKIILIKDRFAIIPSVYKQLQVKHELLNDSATIVVETAISLDDVTIGTIKSRLEDYLRKRVRIVNKVDPAILGGMVIYMNGGEFNASIGRKFKALRNFLLKS